MAFDEHFGSHALAIAIFVAALVLVTSFLVLPFLSKKRWKRGDSSGTNANNLQQQQQEGDGSPNAPSSSSLPDPETGNEFEVFLSFRGSEIGKTFTDYLYHRLIDAGVRAFRDNEELRVGEEIGPKLIKSIEQSKIGIPILSNGFASSKWCLMEVTEMVKSMKENKQLIMPIFLDITPDEVQHQTGSYADSFSEHEKRCGQEKAQAWRDALKEVVKLKGLELAKVANGHHGEFTKLVVARVIRELKKSYLEVGNVLVGIDDRAEELTEKLEVAINDVRVVGIWGMGGIGKTTLAKFVYNQIVDKFESNSFLKDIRETSKNPRGLQYLQSKLVSDILKSEQQEYTNIEEGISVLKERLRSRKALILLDDVDHIDQIKALAADIGWFSQGSRIIITTRERKVLDQIRVHDSYEVPLLETDQALELFSIHAFRDKLPRHELMKEALEIVNIIGGLPLPIEVIGSFLSIFIGRKDIWHDTIEKLKRKTDRDIQDKLGISYESLDHEQKEIFLDIACFFSGMDVRLVIPMWNDAKFFPEVGIELLLLKSLIKIGEDNTVRMHDQLRDIGRSIVEQEDKEPGQRSRLWHGEDGVDVLLGQQGTSKVEAISLEGYHFMEEEDHLNDEMFKNLSRLRILQLAGAMLEGNFPHIFNQLRWLSWHRENLSPPENLVLKNLIALDLSWSLTLDDWIGWRMIKIGLKLKVLNLSNCRISRTPEFSAFPYLESLILESCEQLVWVDPSIELLKNLILLNLRKCQGLKKLPQQLGSVESLVEFLIDDTGVEELPISRGMTKLEVLSTNNCKCLRELPQSVGSLVNLKRLSIMDCSRLDELPYSLGQLTSLVELNLSHTKIRRLPDFVGDLHNLELLKIDYTNITCLPGNLGSLKKLKVIDASWNAREREISDDVLSLSSLRVLKFCGIKSLPEGMSALSCLQTLWLSYCQNLETLPELPSSLTSLVIQEASLKLTSVNLANLVNLKELILSRDFELKEECLFSLRKLENLTLDSVKIRALPEEVGAFSRLKELRIYSCMQLECLPTLPSSLSFLEIEGCISLERLPDVSNLKKLSRLEVRSCPKISEIEGLGNLVSLKVLSTAWSPVTKLDGVEGLKLLTDLSAFRSRVETLPNLSKLNDLKRLSLKDCSLLKHLPELPSSLEKLYLAGCERISNIDAVAELELLADLDISECRSLRKLPDLSKLQFLRIIIMTECEHITEVRTRSGVLVFRSF